MENYRKLSIKQYLKESKVGVTRQAVDYAIKVSKKIDAVKTEVYGRPVWLIVMSPKTESYVPNGFSRANRPKREPAGS